jgi:hypothetical protein
VLAADPPVLQMLRPFGRDRVDSPENIQHGLAMNEAASFAMNALSILSAA